MTRGGDTPRAPHTPLAAGREFDAVREMLARWGSLAEGGGDDCAVVDLAPGERLCVSTDSSVEDVHFRRAWLTPGEIGYRAAAAALSDLAAMAARPVGLLLAITVPPAWRPLLGALADGVGEAAGAAGAPIVGGDTTSGAVFTLTVTVLGSAADPVRRSGARPGDRLYVTGRLGAPLAALRAFERGDDPRPVHRARFARPEPRVREARWLAARGARAMIDVSDGLLGDVGHLAAASGVRIVVDAGCIPCAPGVTVAEAVTSGEEYELVCALPGAVDTLAFEAEFGVALTEIGRVEVGAAEVAFEERGRRVDLPGGYDHFSSR